MLKRNYLLYVVLIIVFISCVNLNKYAGKFQPEILSYQLQNKDTLLDIGCSNGVHDLFIAHEYPKLFLVLEDVKKVFKNPKNGKKYWAAKTFRKNKTFSLGGKKRIKFLLGTNDSIPVPDTSYSAILCRKTLHEFINRDKMIKEMERVLKIKGELIIAEAIPKTKGEIDKGCKKPHLTKEEITELFKALEFTGCDTLDYYLKKNKQKYAGSIGIYRFKKKTT